MDGLQRTYSDDWKCFNPEAFSRLFRLLLKLFLMIMNLFNEAKKEPVIISINEMINMSDLINEFSLAGNRNLRQVHFKQPRSTYE